MEGTTVDRALDRNRHGLAHPVVSNLVSSVLPALLQSGRLPVHRDDFEPNSRVIPDAQLQRWQNSIAVHSELDCAVCLGRVVRPVAPVTCGHIMCKGCCAALLQTGAGAAGDLVTRERRGVFISEVHGGGAHSGHSGHSGHAKSCFPRTFKTSAKARNEAKRDIIEAVRVHARTGDVTCTASQFGESSFASFHLPGKTRDDEDAVALAMDGTGRRFIDIFSVAKYLH